MGARQGNYAVSEATRNGMITYEFKALLQREGWIRPAYIQVNSDGIIDRISREASECDSPIERVNGYALPGFQNAHSHAFQYALAGMAETHLMDQADDFWSWRQAMYDCALKITPDQMQVIATMLYCEMLRRGYTSVAEFHYLHHDRDGQQYSRASEMGVSLLAAAAVAGIKITLVPVYYQKGGFGKEAESSQKRFCFQNVDQYFNLLDECQRLVRNMANAGLGFGVHSLRAAEAGDIIKIAEDGPRHLPFHIHAAEQIREVNDSLQALKQRPVEWLLDHLPLDERFHLIHCTHLTDQEVQRLANSGAHVVLCPGTEANLGDGIFRLRDFARTTTHWSIGTDSHISLNPLEDLRWLDYTQRLTSNNRNTLGDNASTLVRNTFFAGKKAMGYSPGDYFEVGQPFDAVVYDGNSPLINTADMDHLLPTLLYTADTAAVAGTIVNGMWVAKGGRHHKQEETQVDFQKTMRAIRR